MSNDLDIEKYFEFVKELTLQAGKILENEFKSKRVVYGKGKWDYVTDCDYKIEKLFINSISNKFPEHKIIAEETMSTMKKMPELTDAPTWFLDPIDGTINFMHLFPQFCISIALTICKELVLGIIFNPSNSELYTAIKGKGAFLNGTQIYTSGITELNKALLLLETSIIKYKHKDTDLDKTRMEILIETAETTRNVGSAALSLAYIARGIADCFQLDYIKAWDVAAGTLILREAGGTILETKGNAYNIMNPKTVAASSESLAQEISKLIIDTDLKTLRKRLHRT